MTKSNAHDAPTALTIAGAPWFETRAVQTVFRTLNRDGHEARVVGGAVRNALMGTPVADVDFATTATPDEVTRFATEAGLKAVGTGLRHGTVTLVVEGRPYEVTTLRHDVETFGRHATVAFTRDWAADAMRRDFTMNALYADADGRVFDPLGGLIDLHARRVCFIGVARERIREDYLRILRFFRFTAEYAADGPDVVGFHAAVAERAGLALLSAERVQGELWRILKGRAPCRALQPMADGGFLNAVLGGVARLEHVARLVAIEGALGLAPDATRRLAALAVMVDEDAARLAGRLRLSSADAVRLAGMAAHRPVVARGMDEGGVLSGKACPREGEGDAGFPQEGATKAGTGTFSQLDRGEKCSSARVALYRLGAGAWRDRVLIAWARSGDAADDDTWRALATLPDRWQAPEFPLKGADMLAAGVAKGPRVGEALRAAEVRWIASGFSLGRDELLKSVR